MLKITTHGVEFSIAGGVEEIVRAPNSMSFFFFLSFFFFFFFFYLLIFFFIMRSLFLGTRSFVQR